MYVCDRGWYKLCMAESVVPGKSKHLYGENVGLRISYLTIVQYVNDMQLATQWRFHCSTVSLTCFTVTLWTLNKFYTYSCRNIITIVMLWIFMCSLLPKTPSWKHYHWSAGAEKHAKGGLLCWCVQYRRHMYIIPMPSPKYKTHHVQLAISHLLCKT